MTSRTLICITVVALGSVLWKPRVAAQSCPSGTYDMVRWMTQNLSGDHTQGAGSWLYTVNWTDKFWWLKNSAGHPWDVKLYDNFINNHPATCQTTSGASSIAQGCVYDWVTECGECDNGQGWNDPKSYKKWHNPGFGTDADFVMPWAPRCYTSGGSKPGAVFDIPASQAQFERFGSLTGPGNCQLIDQLSLGNVRVELWGPYWTYGLGGNLPNPLQTIKMKYYYSCSILGDPSSCQYLETDEYGYNPKTGLHYGNVRWSYYVNGVLQNQVVHNTVAAGTTSPYWVCQ